ncbi:MAG: methyltransferase domain-containing protein [Planctomycetes bacterium]|nr:methyltransferase domain-containing protein [Planctomycetota bacterium]
MTDWNANEYHRQSALQQAMADQQLAKLHLGGSERILDIGCGDGKITAAIATRVPNGSVLGIDPSQDMIAFASRQFSNPPRDNLRFEVADARQFSQQAEFDLVVSFNALHWVPEQLAALKAIHMALKPAGQALLRFVPQGARKSLEDVIEDTRQSPKWAGNFGGFRTPFVHFTVAEYQALAEQAGLRVQQIEVEDHAWDFQTREAFVAFCGATLVEWTKCLIAQDRPAFIAEVLDRYAEVISEPASAVHTFRFYQMQVALRVG